MHEQHSYAHVHADSFGDVTGIHNYLRRIM